MPSTLPAKYRRGYETCSRRCAAPAWPIETPGNGCSNSAQFNRARRTLGLQHFIHRPTHVFCGQISQRKERLIVQIGRVNRPNDNSDRPARKPGRPRRCGVCRNRVQLGGMVPRIPISRVNSRKPPRNSASLPIGTSTVWMREWAYCPAWADTVTDSGLWKKSGSDANPAGVAGLRNSPRARIMHAAQASALC